MVVLDSRLDAVKVYRSGATVTRRASLEGPLPDEIELRPLPLSLYDATVRVTVARVDGQGADVVVGDVRVGLSTRAALEATPFEDEDALRAAEREHLERTRRLAQLDEEVRLLEEMPVPERARGREGRPPPPSPLAARAALVRFTDEALEPRRAERRALVEELRALDERVRDLRARKERASASTRVSPGDLVKTVVARVHATGSVRAVELVVEYFVPGARWAPSYQCHLSRDGREASVQLRALVCQRTGEDWRGVTLTLSTAAPLRWSELPELPSLRIGRAQPPRASARGFRPAPKGALALFTDYDVGRERAAGLLPRMTSWVPPALELAPLDLEGLPAGAAPRSSSRVQRLGGVASGGPPLPMPPPAPPAALAAPLPMRMKQAKPAADPITAEGLPAEEELDDEDPTLSLALDEADVEADAFESKTDVERSALGRPGLARMRPAPGSTARGDEDGMERLLFTRLELGPPEDRALRNRLRPVDERRRYLELLTRAGASASFDVLAVVHAAVADAEAVTSLPLPDGAVDVARVSGHFDFAYRADDAVDVGSDGVWSSLPLGTRACDAELRYVVVPREDTNVYRVAMLKNPLKAPLLAGPTEVFVGGEYVLTTRLPTVAPGGELRLGLGVEQAIKCARNTRFSERHSGDRVGMTLLEHRVEIDLVNHLPREVHCEVRERVPQPEPGAEVMVDEEGVEPPWESYDQEERSALIQGGRRWLVTVPAEGERKLRAGYVVRIYANTELVGGNRREA